MNDDKRRISLNGFANGQSYAMAKLISHLADQGSIDLDKYLGSLTNQARAERSHDPDFSDVVDRLIAEVKNLRSQGKPQGD